jgi:uncharacterized protein
MVGKRRTLYERRRGVAAAAFFVVCLLANTAPALAQQQPLRFFRIGTAATTGTYFVIGAEIANAISKPPGSRDCAKGGSCGVEGLVAVAQATQGSIENVLGMGTGQLEAALVQADIAKWAFAGKAPVAKACKGGPPLPENGAALLNKVGAIGSLRAIAALYPETIHVVARADTKIKTLTDLKGKRVSLGEPGSGTLAEARLVLEAAGVTECQLKALYPRLSEAAGLLQKDALDAFFVIGGYPVPAVTDVASMEAARLLPIAGATREKLVKQFPFVAASIPGATYPSIDGETETVAVPALFIVSAILPDDLVYGITQALWQESTRRLLDNGHPAGKRIRFDTALTGLSIPLHPGALRYYREKGASEELLRPSR